MSDEILTLHLDAEAIARLDAEATSNGYTHEAFAARLVEEGLRMAKHHGIFFNPGPTGRRAVIRAGPDVWEVIRAFKNVEDLPNAIELVAETADLTPYDVQMALKYYAAYQVEIDARIRLSDEADKEAQAAWMRQDELLNR
jgi:hypothetical protein